MKKNGLVILLIFILIGGGFILFLKNQENDKLKGNSQTGNTNVTDKSDVTDSEKDTLKNDLQKVEKSLGFITVLTSIDKYNAGGDYVTKKGKNLLEDTSKKQLFIMEQLLTDSNNIKNFVVLNTVGEIDKSAYPTEDATTSYYPYDLFKKEYDKYFADDFDLEKRQKSGVSDKYDNDKNYIYYENRRAGLNGLNVDKMDIETVNKIDKNKYQATIILNYSENLAKLLNVSSEKGELTYTKENDGIKIVSFILK